MSTRMTDTTDLNISNAEAKAYAREDLIYNVTEDILVLLEDKEISKQELARRLGKSKSFVSQTLSGARNMTIGTLSDICFAVGVKPQVLLPIGKAEIPSDHQYLDAWQCETSTREGSFFGHLNITRANVIRFPEDKIVRWNEVA